MRIEIVPCLVVAPCRPWVGMPSGVLDVSKTGARVEAQRHEGVLQIMRVEPGRLLLDRLLDQPAQRPPRLGSVPARTGPRDKQRPGAAVTDIGVDDFGGAGREWHRGRLPALARDLQHSVSALGGQVVDVRPERLGDPKPVQP